MGNMKKTLTISGNSKAFDRFKNDSVSLPHFLTLTGIFKHYPQFIDKYCKYSPQTLPELTNTNTNNNIDHKYHTRFLKFR